jgi:hypothetical protein
MLKYYHKNTQAASFFATLGISGESLDNVILSVAKDLGKLMDSLPSSS